jgi:hypothetical protein
VQQQITYAGTVSRSFAEGSELLERLADVTVSAKQVERVTRRIGTERVAERDARVAAYQALPLVEKFVAPAGVPPPDLAVIMADGGRLQILDRTAPPAAASPPEGAGAVAAEVAADEAVAWDEEAASAGHWREDKVGLLLTMRIAVAGTDPCPEIPASFLDAARIHELARALTRHVTEPVDATSAAPAEATPEPFPEEATHQPPQVGQRRVLASGLRWPAFAPVVAAAAWAWGFQGAARKAFVGDGSANHWRLQRRFFGSFTPILDFIRALSYVYAAATAGQVRATGWACYRQWIAWVWQGQVARVIAALEGRHAELGPPENDAPETSLRQVVARALTYLRNQQDKMRYDEYRRQGLPITSSLMESVVKQVKRRVKGTDERGDANPGGPRPRRRASGRPAAAAGPDQLPRRPHPHRDRRADAFFVKALCYSSVHRGGANFLFRDGRVLFLNENLSLTPLRALVTRAGGEVIGEDL